jgi:3-hydroxy-D-aspartate aldolase
MERPIFQPVGTPEEELDTPALVVDLDVMDQNIDTVHGFFRRVRPDGATLETEATVRPHVSCHGCPEIAQRQVSADEGLVDEPASCTGGIAVSSLGEAEVFAGTGFNDILIAGRVVTVPKIRRLLALARDNWVFLAVDNLRNVQDLSAAAVAVDASVGVLIDIDAGYGHGGVAPGPDAVSLARSVDAAPGLAFMGITAYEGPPVSTDRTELESETRRRLQTVVDTQELMENEGLEVQLVSVGSTYDYDVAADIGGVNEVQAGRYPLMDMETLGLRPELQPAAKVLATVISHPVGGRAVVDAGHKTMGPDFGVPTLDGVPGAVATRFSAEHGILELDGAATEQLMPNDKVRLIPHNLSLCFNQFDYVRAVRDGKLVGYWPISARGQLG